MMVRPFFACSVATLTHLLKEESLTEGESEGTQQLVRTLLELERSRGQAVGHLLSSAITLDCNDKLVRHGSLLPSMALPSALATEAYQLPFDPAGSSMFDMSLPALLERAGEVAAQRRQQSLEEALVKMAKGAKSQRPLGCDQ